VWTSSSSSIPIRYGVHSKRLAGWVTGRWFQRAAWIAEKGLTVLSFHSGQHPETRVDVFASEPFDFATEHRLAVVEEIAPGVPVRIVRLAALLRLKRAAGRPQDLADIAELKLLHGAVSDGSAWGLEGCHLGGQSSAPARGVPGAPVRGEARGA
jgi:hypothetical protein